jgi:hypothetical protein
VTTNKSVHLIGHLPKGDNFTWSCLLSLYQLSPIEDLHFTEEFNLIKISYCNTLHSPKHLTEPHQRSCGRNLISCCGSHDGQPFILVGKHGLLLYMSARHSYLYIVGEKH